MIWLNGSLPNTRPGQAPAEAERAASGLEPLVNLSDVQEVAILEKALAAAATTFVSTAGSTFSEQIADWRNLGLHAAEWDALESVLKARLSM